MLMCSQHKRRLYVSSLIANLDFSTLMKCSWQKCNSVTFFLRCNTKVLIVSCSFTFSHLYFLSPSLLFAMPFKSWTQNIWKLSKVRFQLYIFQIQKWITDKIGEVQCLLSNLWSIWRPRRNLNVVGFELKRFSWPKNCNDFSWIRIARRNQFTKFKYCLLKRIELGHPFVCKIVGKPTNITNFSLLPNGFCNTI